MKNIIIAIIATLFSYSISVAQNTNDKPMAKPQSSVENPKKGSMKKKESKKSKKHCYGMVENIDLETGKILVQDKKKKDHTYNFVIEKDTKITKNKKIITINELMKGDKLEVLYEGEIEQPVIKEIKVKNKKEIKEKKMNKDIKKQAKQESSIKKAEEKVENEVKEAGQDMEKAGEAVKNEVEKI